jgi:hypothetical protein
MWTDGKRGPVPAFSDLMTSPITTEWYETHVSRHMRKPERIRELADLVNAYLRANPDPATPSNAPPSKASFFMVPRINDTSSPPPEEEDASAREDDWSSVSGEFDTN